MAFAIGRSFMIEVSPCYLLDWFSTRTQSYYLGDPPAFDDPLRMKKSHRLRWLFFILLFPAGGQASGPLLGGWSSLGLSGGVGLVLGDGALVDGAVSAEFCVSVFTVVEGAERKSALLLALAFARGLSLAALVAGGGALTALRLDASSTDVRASATITSPSWPPFALATVAGGCEAVRSDGLIV